MPVVAESGYRFTAYDHTSGYSGGATLTRDHEVAPGFFSVHVGLARILSTQEERASAAVGVVSFGSSTPLEWTGDPADWETAAYGVTSIWTVAWQAIHGEMTGWEFFQVWA